MVAAEAAAAGSLPLVARHSGLAEIADALEEEGVPASFESGQRRRPGREARLAPRAIRIGARGAQAARPPRRRATLVVGNRRRPVARAVAA